MSFGVLAIKLMIGDHWAKANAFFVLLIP